MQRVKRSTAVAVLPAAPAGGTPGYFASPNPTGGVPATQPGYEWYNGIQEELMAVIEGQGLAGSSSDNTLLRQAIAKMVQGGQRAVVLNGMTFNAGVANGNVVYWDSANSRFDKALADGTNKQNAVGIADVTNSAVYAFGDYTAMSGLTPGARYYLDGTTAGAVTSAAPTNQVFIGIAKSATEIFVDIDTAGLTQAQADARYVQIANARIRLTADITFYVATTGSDSNNGLSPGAAFLTPQKAVNVIHDGYDLNGHVATIQLGDATYTGSGDAVTVKGPFVGAKDHTSVVLKGNAGAPANVVLGYTSGTGISLYHGARMTIQDVKIAPVTAGHCISVFNGAFLSFSNLIFGAVGAGVYNHINAQSGGQVQAVGNYSVIGGALYHILCDINSSFYGAGLTITLTGTPAFTTFCYAAHDSVVDVFGNTFSGSATGARYQVFTNAVIETNGGGANYLPGNAAGSYATGGQYV